MANIYLATIVTAALLPSVVSAQSKPSSAPAATPAPAPVTGCVSAKPDANGRYVFTDENGVLQYQLKGRRLSRFAGQRVELVGGAPGGGGLAVRGGLVGPQAGARGVALDPSQESVRRQPGGGGTGVGATMPEFQVSRIKVVDGAACEEPGRR
jgi:hypothetical protein